MKKALKNQLQITKNLIRKVQLKIKIKSKTINKLQ